MKLITTIATVAALVYTFGCARVAEAEDAGGGVLLTVDFEPNQVLRYKFVTTKEETIDWSDLGAATGAAGKVNKFGESFEMVASYTPVEVDPYGLSRIRVTCESLRVTRTGGKTPRGAKADAAETLAGKSWTIAVSPIGKIEDACEFRQALIIAGRTAIRHDPKQGTIKDQDMLYDVIASQWFMWDPVASRSNFTSPVNVGDEWRSLLSVPAPMIVWVARDTTYRLDEIRAAESGRLAVVKAKYEMYREVPRTWPVPYEEVFQASGTFGFLRRFKPLALSGEGEELFNIDAGRVESRSQSFRVELQASLPMGIGGHPKVTIEQKTSMELVPAETAAK